MCKLIAVGLFSFSALSARYFNQPPFSFIRSPLKSITTMSHSGFENSGILIRPNAIISLHSESDVLSPAFSSISFLYSRENWTLVCPIALSIKFIFSSLVIVSLLWWLFALLWLCVGLRGKAMCHTKICHALAHNVGACAVAGLGRAC